MTLGVLGGLGPGATVHFMNRLVEKTPATSDQEHIETIVYNDPTVPDRTDAILCDGPSPRAKLVENAKFLDEAGCDAIVIDSNTTHYYYDSIEASVEAEVPHLVELVTKRVEKKELYDVGVITTKPAVEMGLYGDVAETVVYSENLDSLMNAMYSYKSGKTEQAMKEYAAGIESIPKGVDGYVVGCTDFSALSSAFPRPRVDALEVLVDWCVDRFAEQR
jgi:aspartate racemase